MINKILSGKPIAKQLREQIQSTVQSSGIQPGMLLIQVGADPASDYYVQNIIKTGNKLGCSVIYRILDISIDQNTLIEIIQEGNIDPTIHGIMIQKPLPKTIDEKIINSTISPEKDIDGIHPMNLGRIMVEDEYLLPCTPSAVLKTIEFYGIPTAGKHVVIIGRSTVVGKPLAALLIRKTYPGDATVTICHSKTHKLHLITRTADIIVAAIGKPNFITEDMIGDNTVLIDVGINLITNPDSTDQYVGDIDYKSCFDKALAITPVPGGIGTITTSVLFENLLRTALVQEQNKSVDDFATVIFHDM
ncbi:MAG: bifunctional 5,10-methylene-tetrahydrofolate dehydrogenase/5,10-methylene-tetrahydrofolate cyclohydrolase [Candidatus Cloacimonetes bacterium HGW-Cloacimonetes-1]|nr:MAG: bifunctional 5,10-methylene-tetrahydrofolate dehydrogenase/5,10-methylene-tetrahydrofolate cyclohydrolase [Candidatus Cloacimonetes bacterium HGW-Cloacimonetes-1]